MSESVSSKSGNRFRVRTRDKELEQGDLKAAALGMLSNRLFIGGDRDAIDFFIGHMLSIHWIFGPS